VARATYPALGFPQYAARSATATPTRQEIGSPEGPLLPDCGAAGGLSCTFSGTASVHRRKSPSIADIRLAATLEFLAVIGLRAAEMAKDYTVAMEKKLGKAYAEPAADVRGYIAYVRSQPSVRVRCNDCFLVSLSRNRKARVR